MLRFADKLKDVVSILYGWDRKRLDGLTPEDRIWRETRDDYWSGVFERDITPRYVLEFIGTDIIRTHLHLHFWVYMFHQEILKCPPDSVVIIPDCRFWNEYQLTVAKFPNITTCVVVTSNRNECPVENKNRINSIISGYTGKIMDNYSSIIKQIEDVLNPKEHRSEWENTIIGLSTDKQICGVCNDFKTLEELHKELKHIFQ